LKRLIAIFSVHELGTQRTTLFHSKHVTSKAGTLVQM